MCAFVGMLLPDDLHGVDVSWIQQCTCVMDTAMHLCHVYSNAHVSWIQQCTRVMDTAMHLFAISQTAEHRQYLEANGYVAG